MTTRFVDYCAFTKLTCAWGETKTVVLCLQDPALVAQPDEFCDDSSSTILATICQAYTDSNSCQTTLWHYRFSYESEVLAIPGTPLATADIVSVFCLDCLTTWISEQRGVDVTVVTEDDGSQTVVSEHGCEYPINAPLANGLFFGNGVDGPLTVTSDTLLTYPARNYFFTDLTIDASGTLHPYGCFTINTPSNYTNLEYFQIFVKGTLTINGILSADGDAASGVNAGNQTFGNPRRDGPGGGADVGGTGAGATVVGNASAKMRGDSTLGQGFMGGGLGGASGTGGGGGGSGYTPSIVRDGAPFICAQLLTNLLSYNPLGAGLARVIGGGCAGAGGGGGANGGGTGGAGGGGGGSGGSIYIAAKNIVIGAAGKISAKGGAGANGAAGVGGNASGGGGGGGGGGGMIYLIYETLTNAGTIDVNPGGGGTGGAAVGSGSAGGVGVAGQVGKVYKVNMKLGVFE